MVLFDSLGEIRTKNLEPKPSIMKVLILLLLPCFAYTQSGGTLIIAAIGSDGIMIAADSRSYIGTRGHAIAYHDNYQKINILNGYQIAIAGINVLGDKPIYVVMNDFNKKYRKHSSIEISLTDFNHYLDNIYGEKYNYGFNKYIGGTYDHGIPELVAFFPKKKPMIGKRIASITTEPGLDHYFIYTPMTCKQLGVMAEKAILKYALDSNLTYSIGGPITIVQITPDNNVHYLQNDFTNSQYKRFHLFFEAFKAKKITLTCVNGNTEKDVLDFFDHYFKIIGYKKSI